MPDLFVSWPEYHQKIEQLAVCIYESHWPLNQIVCLARGGLRIGDVLSRLFDLPLAVLATASYGGEAGQLRGSLKIAEHLTMTTGTLGSHVLLVDDLVDSGTTFQEVVGWLTHHHGADLQALRTAVLWYKAGSSFQPDYYVDYLPDNPWIHQPFERYEHTSPAELKVNP
ncbi:phosphoribosyltransferase [Neosynechococcus sphagnicola sy1]|uniref:Phosphoribosyltransferase n=1 Tax=Neosynechococcus sphagnicola sy1 TaxID=1497020 RepID=A0A098TLL8_9CYAN|nr:phosphoribosyltransferase family protein [Neosynechococcus sphagnicola]KGF72767.1 phosphoribosyltransferase [Neosynechococcus sphagnicola sy1]